MVHTHSHSHDHSHESADFSKAFVVATLLNLIYTIIQATYAFYTNSMGLLADASHNLGDVIGLLMAWGATFLLKQVATERYSYGYKKTTILSALANALILVFSSGIIIYQSINKLIYPAAINEKIVIVVAAIGVLINSGTALLFMRGQEHDLNIKGAFLHLINDALISLGVVAAAIIIHFTGWMRLDPLVGLLIVVVILWSTWGLLRNSVSLILGAVPHNVDARAVRQYLSEIKGVTAVHDLHIWGLSTRENALTAHLVIPEVVLSDADYTQITHVLKHDFKINHVTLQVEKGDSKNPCTQAMTC